MIQPMQGEGAKNNWYRNQYRVLLFQGKADSDSDSDPDFELEQNWGNAN
jgi:hypothetical protein